MGCDLSRTHSKAPIASLWLCTQDRVAGGPTYLGSRHPRVHCRLHDEDPKSQDRIRSWLPDHLLADVISLEPILDMLVDPRAPSDW